MKNGLDWNRMKRTPALAAEKPPPRETEMTGSGATEVVLVAVTGLSPAVVTETVWALADTEGIVPHRVVAVTTAVGRPRITEELETADAAWGGQTVWEALRAAVVRRVPGTEGRLVLQIRVMEQPDVPSGRMVAMQDIRSVDDSIEAADAILSAVEEVTKEPDRTLLASVAGGRKSMGALLYGAVSLRGRPGDRILHVLVDEPFEDGRLRPQFYFPPEVPVEHTIRGADGTVQRRALSTEARIQLADVPFVPLRHLVPEGELAGGFRGMVARITGAAMALGTGPAVFTIDRANRTLTVAGQRHVPKPPQAFDLLVYILEQQGTPALRAAGGVNALDHAVQSWQESLPAARRKPSVDAHWLSKAMNAWRKALPAPARRCLPDRGLAFPPLQLAYAGDLPEYPGAGNPRQPGHSSRTRKPQLTAPSL
jgi:CRISPR-associated protein (TIGR02584 family)